MSGAGEGHGGVLHKGADWIERFMDGGQVWFVLVALAFLLLLQIPGVDELLGIDNSAEVRNGIAVLALASILLELRQLNRRVTPAISGRQQYPDPGEMYDTLKEKAKEITDPEQQEIKVLGLTLYSAWPVLSFFLERPEVRDWTVKLATLSKNACASRQCVPADWPKESATTVSQVLQFRNRQGREHRHRIEVYEYEFPPAVHGFRLGNGDVFICTQRWEDGRFGKHRFSYDYVPAHDGSASATAARELFKNWFDQAVSNAAEVSARSADPDPATSGEPAG
jgi:hypothetical protein